MHDDPRLPGTGGSEPEVQSAVDSTQSADSQLQRDGTNSWPALSFNANEFIEYVKDHNLSEAEAYEFLVTVWVYMITFVDLGFGIHPIQQAQDSSRNNPELDHESALMISSQEAFNSKSTTKTERRQVRRAVERDS